MTEKSRVIANSSSNALVLTKATANCCERRPWAVDCAAAEVGFTEGYPKLRRREREGTAVLVRLPVTVVAQEMLLVEGIQHRPEEHPDDLQVPHLLEATVGGHFPSR